MNRYRVRLVVTDSARLLMHLDDTVGSTMNQDGDAITAAGGMKQVQAAIARWISDHDQPEAADGVFFIVDCVVAGQPIDRGFIEAAWSAP